MLGTLTETIAIDVEDGQGDAEWREICRMRAAVKPVRASEAEREGALRTVQVYLFKVLTSALRAMPVTASHRIRWKGTSYNVREVRSPVDREPFTEIVAESGVTL